MNDTKKFNVNIETLSPIHIGSGESYTTSEFIHTKTKGKNGLIDIIST